MDEINNIQELEAWCEIHNKNGYLKHGKLLLSNFSGYSLTLNNFKNLSIIIQEGSHSSKLFLNRGSFNEIIIPEGDNNIIINGITKVDLLKCKGHANLKRCNITFCESESTLDINECTISTLKQKGKSLKINDSYIKHLECRHSGFYDGFDVKDISYFLIEGLKPINVIELSFKFKKESELHIIKCDLSKIKFQGCDFSGTILYSLNSEVKLKDYYDTKWFKKIRKLSPDGSKTMRIPRDECRQLKLTAQNLENSIDADFFRAMELHAHYQELKLFSDRFDSKITLALNLISNRFERSWIIPMLWILGFGFIMFIPYYFFSNLWIEDRICFHEYLKFYWIFLNPLHSFDMLGPDKATGASLAIDTLHRILNSYFIYQLVAAFRKFRVAGS